MKSFLCLISSLVFAALPASALGYSIGSYQSARVLDKGQVSIGFGTGLLHLEEEDGYSNFYFVPDVWAHYGIRDGVEIGVSSAPFEAGIDIKTQIVSSEKTFLAIAPHLGLSYENIGSSGDYSSNMFGLSTALSLIVGAKAGERSEVTFNVKLIYNISFTHYEYSDGEDDLSNSHSEMLSIGESFGFIVGSEDLSVIPELGVYHTLSRTKEDGFSSHSEGTMIFPGVGVSILF